MDCVPFRFTDAASAEAASFMGSSHEGVRSGKEAAARTVSDGRASGVTRPGSPLSYQNGSGARSIRH